MTAVPAGAALAPADHRMIPKSGNRFSEKIMRMKNDLKSAGILRT